MLGKITTLIHANLSFVFQVTFICDDDDGEGILILYSQDLLVECAYFLEGIAGCDRVDEQEAFTRSHILLAHGTIFFLSSSIKNIEKGYFVVNYALLAIRVFNGGIILIHEMTLDKLDSQSRLSNTTTTNNDEFIFPQKLGPSSHDTEK